MNENESSEVVQKLRVLQIIFVVLLGGAAIFAGLCLLVSMGMIDQVQDGDQAAAPVDVALLRYVWFGAGAFALAGVAFARKIMPQMAASQIDTQTASPQQLFAPYFIATLVTGAMLEGVSIFGGVLVLLGDVHLDLLLAAAPLVVMLPFFPTRRGFERFSDKVCGRSASGAGLTAPRRDHRRYR